jgi:hypothetical protein
MVENFNGKWVINHDLSTSQKPLLEAMGKPMWQIYVINDADEDFELIHTLNAKNVHCFTKNVRMFLNSKFLTVIATLITIPFNEFQYNHCFEANGVKVHYPNDKKDFGDCDAITTYNSNNNTFTIRWQLKYGLLTAVHSLTDLNQFRIDMNLKRPKVPEINVSKVYNRKKS